MKVPQSMRNVFFRWDNATQQEVELPSDAVLALLTLTSEDKRDSDWKLAERVYLDAPLKFHETTCDSTTEKASVIPNQHGFPHWAKLYPHQQIKANKLSLTEKDFRDYDQGMVSRVSPGCAWTWANPVYVVTEVLAYQDQQTLVGRFMAWTRTVPGFWGGVTVGVILVFVFGWFWDCICPIQPSGLSAHEMEIQNIVNQYYYSSWVVHAIGQFWGSVIFFVIGFVVGREVFEGSSIPRGRFNY